MIPAPHIQQLNLISALFDKPHNNAESQLFYDENKEHFKNQAERVINWLLKGVEVSSRFCALQIPMIVDTRARIKKLKELGYKISERTESFGKVWFIPESDREYNMELFERLKG